MKLVEGTKIYTVSEVNYFAKEVLEEMTITVEGEISSIKKNPNWSFYYLDLKDDYAILPCIVSGYLVEKLEIDIQGQLVTAHGNLSLYEPLGKYQLRIQSLKLAGDGALAKKLQMLINKLKTEGLFDPKYKKDIPLYPRKICLVTSKGSDAWNDFKKHTVDKFPIIELDTADVRVQGQNSISQILKIIPVIDKMNYDTIVITRGGGSPEDLAAFNDESVARAIFQMKTPTVVAIGHESNESLAEWVADKRASTPTDAANIVTSGYQKLLGELQVLKSQLSTKASYFFSKNYQMLDYYYYHLSQMKISFKDLPYRLGTIKESLKRHQQHLTANADFSLNENIRNIEKNIRIALENKNQKLSQLKKNLAILSPKNTLNRGYSIATDKNGHIIKSPQAVVVGETVGVKLAQGSIKTKVIQKSS